jgi:hypothetical protein
MELLFPDSSQWCEIRQHGLIPKCSIWRLAEGFERCPRLSCLNRSKQTSETPVVVHGMNLLPQMRSQQPSSAAPTSRDIENLQALGMFCGVGLLASVLRLAYGVDTSSEWF